MGIRKLSQSWASCKLSSVKAVCSMQVLSQPVINGEAGCSLLLMIHMSLDSSTQSGKLLVSSQKESLWVEAAISGVECVNQ